MFAWQTPDSSMIALASVQLRKQGNLPLKKEVVAIAGMRNHQACNGHGVSLPSD